MSSTIQKWLPDEANFSEVTKDTLTLRPPLKWAGGKRWLVPRIRDFWEKYSSYRLVEPFAGGLSIALGLMPKRALLNDINPHLINFYYWLQKGLCVTIEMRNNLQFYYELRDRFNQSILRGEIYDIETAQIFYYLNRTGFNGLCRFNSKGTYNVPFGRYKTINYIKDFSDYAPVLSAWEFTSRDFSQLITEPTDFIYADPPYDVEFTKYSKHDFTWEDQVRLAEWLTSQQGVVVVSNQATERIISLYTKLGFSVDILTAPRRISCTGDRTPAQEMLAYRGFDYGKERG